MNAQFDRSTKTITKKIDALHQMEDVKSYLAASYALRKSMNAYARKWFRNPEANIIPTVMHYADVTIETSVKLGIGNVEKMNIWKEQVIQKFTTVHKKRNKRRLKMTFTIKPAGDKFGTYKARFNADDLSEALDKYAKVLRLNGVAKSSVIVSVKTKNSRSFQTVRITD